MSEGNTSSSLLRRIIRQIEIDGPLGISEYMSICLNDENDGYYTTANPLGREGDFVTAPEISQIFGELIGIWCVAMWHNLGKPGRINLVELGPGRGVLMSDLMRAAAIDQGFIEAVQIGLVEISRPLRNQQSSALSNCGVEVEWHDAIQKVDSIPTIFIGNEFLDALPFRQYVNTSNCWMERVVAVEDDQLAYRLGPGVLDPGKLPENHGEQPSGAVYESSPARESIVEFIAEFITSNGGAALLIDYGHNESGFGDTFQAVAKHKFADPLRDPGAVDLTSHVDFSVFQKYFFRDESFLLTTQADFLLKMGLLERAGRLGSGKNKQGQIEIEQAVERLAGPDAMGDLFKVMIASNNGIELAGF